jgi:hypothetical protein
MTLSTQPSLPPQKLAAAALAILGRDGRCEAGTRWTVARESKSGVAFDITCTGPDLPATVEPAIASGALIARQRPWVGTYRLVVRVEHMIALDLYWNVGEPTRIMGFSRGDWEIDLIAMITTT